MTATAEVDPRLFVSTEGLAERLATALGTPAADITDLEMTPVERGTSGDRFWSLVVSTSSDDIRLALKVSRPGRHTEMLFYRDLAPHLQVNTPRVVDLGIHHDRAWILMEEIDARDPMTWTADDYRTVVGDMARMHGRYWGDTTKLEREWMQPTEPEALRQLGSELIGAVDLISDSWLVEACPHLFFADRLERIRSVLADPEPVAAHMRKAGLTFVHGDYWFFNALLTDAGHRVMVDWQNPMIWSGFWELAYFINLLQPLGPAGVPPAAGSRRRHRSVVPGGTGRWRHRPVRAAVRVRLASGSDTSPCYPLAASDGRSRRSSRVAQQSSV